MNYEQKYNASLEQAKKELASCGSMDCDAARLIFRLFPQLRESESEDERIRKELWEYFHNLQLSSDCDFSPSFTIDDVLAYLEKQKALSGLGKYIAAERTKPGFMFAGNDSVSWEELPLDVRKHDYPYYFIGDLDCYPFDVEKQKEQKPTPDWMPRFLDELRSKKNYFDWDEHRDIEGQILAIINWIAPDYFKRKEEQKPQGQCVDVIKMSALLAADRLASAEMTGRLKERKEILKNPEKYGLCKSAEWSEEDEKMRQDLIAYFTGGDVIHNPGLKFFEAAEWLKSLRPSWKPSDK